MAYPMPDARTVLIIAGGTGGHIFPAKAVADAFVERGFKIAWLGGVIGMEQRMISAVYPFYSIDAFQLRGKGMLAMLKMPWRLIQAVRQSLKVIRQIRPCCVISFGGYVSPPGGLAAWLLRIPLYIHEQNARAGMSNRLLSHFSRVTFSAFPGAFKKEKDVRVVGNPIRQNLLCLKSPIERYAQRTGPMRLLVLGGSLGAQAINDTVASWFMAYGHIESVELWHQCGAKHIEAMQVKYGDQLNQVTLEPFIQDMPSALGWADVVICRAGALTVSEVAAVGVAAVFIPMPWAVDNHQLYNAKFLTDHGAGVLLPQAELTPHALQCHLTALDRSKLQKMADKALRLSEKSTVEQVLDQCMADVLS